MTDIDDNPLHCLRCGKPANVDVMISAHAEAKDRIGLGKNILSFNIFACRNCAMDAAELAVKYLRQSKDRN